MPVCFAYCRACYAQNRLEAAEKQTYQRHRSFRCGRCGSLQQLPYGFICPACSNPSPPATKIGRFKIQAGKVVCLICFHKFDSIIFQPQSPTINYPTRESWLGRFRQGFRVADEEYRAALRRFNIVHEKYQAAQQEYELRLNDMREDFARFEWQKFHSASQLDIMSGTDFEVFLQELFVRLGFDARRTPVSGDQGADLIVIDSAGERIAVQAKRQERPVGNKAVQEVIAAMIYYRCRLGIVATNAAFTRSAKELAEKHGHISLWDRSILLTKSAHDVDCPEFSWEEYEQMKERIRVKPTKR